MSGNGQGSLILKEVIEKRGVTWQAQMQVFLNLTSEGGGFLCKVPTMSHSKLEFAIR